MIQKSRISQLRGKILGIEMELNMMDSQLEIALDNIGHLEKTQSDLVYNVALHRKEGVISVAKEYQKTVWQLGHVENKLKQFKNECEMLRKNIMVMEGQYEQIVLEYERVYKQEEEYKERVVLPFIKR